MIPRVCAEQVGQPLPLFIKWGTSATDYAPEPPAPRRSACAASRSGTWPGAIRTTRSTGRRTSTSAIAWSEFTPGWRLRTPGDEGIRPAVDDD